MLAHSTPSPGPDHGEVFHLLADAIQEHLQSNVDEEGVRRIAGEEIAKARLPRPIVIHRPDGTQTILKDRAHRQYEELIELVNEGHRNILMVGPAGSGKTTLGKNVAEGLDLAFGFLSLSAGVTETHLFGRMLPQSDGSWKYIPSRFVEIYEQGGVFLLDEIDAADANVMVAINAALANGVMADPYGNVHHRHAQCYILAAANTWGRGGDQQYVGRNQLDAATLDRFTLSTLFVDYDTDLESDLARGALSETEALELIGWVMALRASIVTYKLRRLASTRLVVNSILALKAGRSLRQIQTRFFQGWSVDEKSKVSA